jgi:hypothetical protein
MIIKIKCEKMNYKYHKKILFLIKKINDAMQKLNVIANPKVFFGDEAISI